MEPTLISHTDYLYICQTDREFEERYTGRRIKPDKIKRSGNKFLEKENFNLTNAPREMDWTKLGCVTNVKFQVCHYCFIIFYL